MSGIAGWRSCRNKRKPLGSLLLRDGLPVTLWLFLPGYLEILVNIMTFGKNWNESDCFLLLSHLRFASLLAPDVRNTHHLAPGTFSHSI